jgi:hypothetical protein
VNSSRSAISSKIAAMSTFVTAISRSERNDV